VAQAVTKRSGQIPAVKGESEVAFSRKSFRALPRDVTNEAAVRAVVKSLMEFRNSIGYVLTEILVPFSLQSP
jgi:hypothetical protein